MTAEDDDRFWLTEADPAVDICDPTLTADRCLDVIVARIAAHVDLSRARILDFGCGIGRLANPLQARYPGSVVFGVDISHRFVAAARVAARVQAVHPRYVVRGDVSGLGETVDAVCTMGVLQHLDNARKRDYLHQFGQILRPGGVVVAQYVEGVHSSRCMHDALEADVTAWCAEAGLTVRQVDRDLLMPRWTWITATREAA